MQILDNRAIAPGDLKPQELEAVYKISREIASTIDTDTILETIVRTIRPVFVFDNMVLYLSNESEKLEPTFARAIGRGRSKEAGLSWGEIAAQDAFTTCQVKVFIEELEGDQQDRTNLRHMLGLPVYSIDQCLGALVFIRFGGPPFVPDQIHLAEFVASHVAQLLERRQLIEKIANLEAIRKLDNLQEDFIAMISHELMTPLGMIKGYMTTLMRTDTEWDEATKSEFMMIITEEADRLQNMIEELLDSSRLQAGSFLLNLKSVDLAEYLQDFLIQLRNRYEKAEIILIELEEGLRVYCDPVRLTFVLDNIIHNAVKYAPDSPIEIGLEMRHYQAFLYIRDYGPGIKEEYLEKIFQRFYRIPHANSTIHGAGLGLYICKRIIQAHGGDIHAVSKPGEGTTFFIMLPIQLE